MDRLDPQAEYRNRLSAWQRKFEDARRQSLQLGNVRLGVAVTAAILAYFAFITPAISGWWLLIPLFVFIALVIYHERIAAREQFAKRGISYYETRLHRFDQHWAGTGPDGKEFDDPEHVYGSDLDLFGSGSLFQLISTARTAAGERILANWFRSPSPAPEVRLRQQAVAEMRDDFQLREDLALLGEDVRAGVHAELLAEWGSAPPVPLIAGARIFCFLIACASVVTFGGFLAQRLNLWPFGISVASAVAAGIALRRAVDAIHSGIDTPAHDLQILSLLLGRLERERFQTPLLKRLRAELDTDGHAPAAAIRRLRVRVDMLDSSDHLLVRIIGPAILWREQSALAIEAWRARNGHKVGQWIAAIAEFEAISSLASFAFERPAAQFPELLEDGPVFEAVALRHPLMSPARAVPNDVSLGSSPRLLILSGSNMSGKSTLLRSIGLNAVLAWSGAPTTADRLRISPMAVGASIRIVDSLQDNRSRFYSEITRLRQIVELTNGPDPVLFLLDEFLSGTNSHDRLIGAQAVIRTLLKRGAIGVVTTHDLALTQIEEEFRAIAANVHFEDHLEDGRISFDYRLKPGVVQRSNALELMRAVGLDVF